MLLAGYAFPGVGGGWASAVTSVITAAAALVFSLVGVLMHRGEQWVERDGHVCPDCGFPYGLELDHTTPWTLTQRTTYHALPPKCRRCHKTKTAAEATITIKAGQERAATERRARERIRQLITTHTGDPPPPG